jgi:phage terminase large subunit
MPVATRAETFRTTGTGVASTLVVESSTAVGLTSETKPFHPLGANLALFGAREHEVVIEGPADCGKSRACLEKVHAAMTKYPGSRAAIVRKTRKSLTSTAMATFERYVAPEGSCRLWNGEEYRYTNGSKIYLFGLDDPERLKSFEGDLAYVQEVSELTKDDWEILTTRVTGRGGTMPYQQVIADLNPREPSFWLYERERTGKTKFLFARHADNPTITPQRLAPLEALTGYLRDRLLLGLRVAAEGMYFTEFDPRHHLVDAFDPPEHWMRWICVDWGFAHPFVALWLAREKPGGHIYVYREISAEKLRDEQQAQLIVERSRGEHIQMVVLDPSMFNPRTEQQRPSIAQIYGAYGVADLSAMGIVPGFNNRVQGWSVVRRALAHGDAVAAQRNTEVEDLPRLKIMHQRCPNLTRNLPAMVMDPLNPEDVADKINHVRTPDDEVDALRYGLCAEAQPNAPESVAHLVFGKA